MYHCNVKNSPFDSNFQLYIDDCSHGEVKEYVEFLEDKIIQLENELRTRHQD
jgi:hypothetical protein